MHELILHHYAASPFAEKIRAILGYKRLAWRSVDIPVVMPKPDLTALTGGYRKTPVLQIGADVYCDTTLISRVLDDLHPEPRVHRPAQDAVAVAAARWLDHRLFFAAIALLFDRVTMGGESSLGGPDAVAAFLQDRGPMIATARVKPPAPAEARLVVTDVLRHLEIQLAATGPFLFGAEAGWADFCAYHPLWALRRHPPLAPALAAHRHVEAWLDRVAAFGHGTPTPLASTEALTIARGSTPRPHDATPASGADGIAIGDEVEIAADDYAFEPSAGRLVHCGADELAIARSDARAGNVVVHFPRVGFRVTARG